MATTINASTSNGLIATADTSGIIQLQSNGTTVATATASGFQIATYAPNASLITSGTSVASTSGTSITFSSIPSWVKRITVMFNGVSTSGTSNILIQFGSGSTTNTGYVTSATHLSSVSPNTANSTTGFIITGTVAAANNYTGNIFITLQTTNAYISSGILATNASVQELSSGYAPSLSGALDRVVITTAGGTDTFDAGSVNILYE